MSEFKFITENDLTNPEDHSLQEGFLLEIAYQLKRIGDVNVGGDEL